MPIAYHDGKFVDKNSVTVSIADFGFSRGVAIFELVRAYGGVPFHLDDHLERLLSGAKTFGIACPLNADELADIVRRLCAENRYAHSMVRFYLTAGEAARVSAVSFNACDGFTPHLIVMEDELRPDCPEAPYGLELYRRGQRLKTVPLERELPMVKSTGYALGYQAARVQAGKEWDDVLFTRRDGVITEATRSNFFCVIDGVLCTATIGILYGVTRKVVLELAARFGIPVAERDFTSGDCARATEAFVASSTVELMPVRQIDDHILSATMDAPVFKKLRQAFTDYVREYCGKNRT